MLLVRPSVRGAGALGDGKSPQLSGRRVAAVQMRKKERVSDVVLHRPQEQTRDLFVVLAKHCGVLVPSERRF